MNESERKQKILWIFTIKTYEYEIKPEAQNVTVESVAYKLDGKDWTDGNTFYSNSKLKSFNIKVADSNKCVTNWVWTGGTEANPEN